MNIFKDFTIKQKYFILVFLIGFFFKYNYLMIQILHIPSIKGLLLKNVVMFLFFLAFIMPLIRNKLGKEFLFWFLFAFTVFFLFNIWYNRYFGNYLSLNDILMGRGFRPFKVLVRQLFQPIDLVFIIDFFILAFYRNSEKKKVHLKKVSIKKYSYKLMVTLIIILIILTGQIVITNAEFGNKRPVVLFNESSSAFVNVYGIIPLYFYEYYVNFHLPDEKIIKEKVEPPPEEALTGQEVIDKKDNIIVIQVESLDNKVLDYKYKGKEVTPFLNKLKENSLYYENFYSQHINGSFDAEFSFLTSIYPINKNYGFKVNDLSQFKSLVNFLNSQEYNTLAFHGNDKTFFYRHKAFPELGFDEFYSREDYFEENKIMDLSESIFGINDYDFFLQSTDYLKKTEEPFFAFFITLTSHTPFDTYPPDETIDNFNSINSRLVRDYFNSIAFLDKSIEMFFDHLDNLGLIDESLIIIYSDHDAGINKEEYTSGRKFIIDRNVKSPENIPLLIIHPNIDPSVVSKEGSTADLAPTILDILGEEKKPEEFLGSSLLDDEEFPILFLHEIAQILYKGQLYARLPHGFEKIGYSERVRNKDIELINKEQIIQIIDYMKGIILKRRAET
ncbi:MAG: sulfatase-like hydrolase/transferase [Halanaerobiales bacterium]|nr:sulfatase-like hydrolase/transferase [Halanaerobiales bacterium]